MAQEDTGSITAKAYKNKKDAAKVSVSMSRAEAEEISKVKGNGAVKNLTAALSKALHVQS